MLSFIIEALATWRISSLLVHEDGPYNVFLELRKRAGFVYWSDGAVMHEPTGILNALACLWCTSVWAAPVVMLMPRSLKRALALSSAAIIVESWGTGRKLWQ